MQSQTKLEISKQNLDSSYKLQATSKKSLCKCTPECKHKSCKNKPMKHVAISTAPPERYPPIHKCILPPAIRPPPKPKPQKYSPPKFTTDSLIGLVSEEICSCRVVANAVRSPQIHEYMGLKNYRTQPLGEVVVPIRTIEDDDDDDGNGEEDEDGEGRVIEEEEIVETIVTTIRKAH